MQIEITPEYLASQGLSKDFPNRFWKKVHKTDSCWVWTRGKSHDGYGLISRGFGFYTKGKNPMIYANRASWILHHGPIPEGMKVLHNCPNSDNTSCVNPNHLWLGTNLQNSQDMKSKGKSISGIKHPFHKITENDVLEIRKLYPTKSQSYIAKQFGITRSNVSAIIRFKSWGHVPRAL